MPRVLIQLAFMSMLLCSCEATAMQNDDKEPNPDRVDITDAIFTRRSADCADYKDAYAAYVKDLQRNVDFDGSVEVTSEDTRCTFTVNGIPNHDFNDTSARFATAVSKVTRTFSLPRSPRLADNVTPLSQGTWDAILLNGVVVDMLSAGCYRPSGPQADADGNVMIGCNENSPWLLDPLGTESKFGADSHNAHTQPDGTYHYHGNPMAMFNDQPGANGSPVIGFAADGFPIYGSYFLDPATQMVRKARSGYSLREGSRPGRDGSDPGGTYDGMYIDDYEFTGAGDLDACNGMTVGGSYGYYVTDEYPWIIACHAGTVDASFSKGGRKALMYHRH